MSRCKRSSPHRTRLPMPPPRIRARLASEEVARALRPSRRTLMSDPFMAEIRIFSFSFAPRGWALCNGQLLPINQNQALFSLLGTNYGGDGRVNFGLPDLRSRAPVHVGSGHTLGERGGEQAHTLSISEIPTHVHVANASNNPGSDQVPG